MNMLTILANCLLVKSWRKRPLVSSPSSRNFQNFDCFFLSTYTIFSMAESSSTLLYFENYQIALSNLHRDPSPIQT
jgi:hypothetical protein